jgi:hypothetical protein
LILLCCLASKVSASPEDDAKYIASQRFLEEEVHTMRTNASKSYVTYLDSLLRKHNIRVKDAERLAIRVPNEITDVAINKHFDDFAKSYLKTFDAQQLSEIKSFFLTGIWQKLRKLSYKECKAEAEDRTVISPQAWGYEEAKIRYFLSPQEFRYYRYFFESETGKAFGASSEHHVSCSDGLTTTGVFSLQSGEEAIRTEFVLSALKTKGLFWFSNPIARKDFIAKLESEIKQ